jgi:hypothetical protein
MVEVAKFNVGGHRYEVARTLLEQHPATMLTRSASETWQQDPETEIFMERNGIRFQYVLDYLRDGKVSLPVTESKEALINDLNYFGIEANGDMINDSDSKLYTMPSGMSAIRKELSELELEIARLELDRASKNLAVKCVKEFYSSAASHEVRSFEIGRNTVGGVNKIEMCNRHLEKFRLKMKSENCNAYDFILVSVQELVKK